ncbi:hypothetical protein ACX84Z_24425, partial [Burkholderia pseudomallei]
MSMPASANPGSAAAEPGFCFFSAARFFAEFPAFRLSAERSGGAASGALRAAAGASRCVAAAASRAAA